MPHGANHALHTIYSYTLTSGIYWTALPLEVELDLTQAEPHQARRLRIGHLRWRSHKHEVDFFERTSQLQPHAAVRNFGRDATARDAAHGIQQDALQQVQLLLIQHSVLCHADSQGAQRSDRAQGPRGEQLALAQLAGGGEWLFRHSNQGP